MIPRNVAVKLLRSTLEASLPTCRRLIGCHSASITKIHRETFARVYRTVVVLPDGASINVRYQEPRKIIKLPLDVSKLSEEERKLRLERRKPKKKVVVEEEVEDSFDASKYINLVNK